MGDCNAPATFVKLMTHVLREGLGRWCFVYLDDILIYSETYKDHLNHIRWVCEQLRKHDIYASKEKTEILPEKLDVLGHLITKEGIKPDPHKLTKIKDWPIPQTRKQLQAFMGMVNYISQFIPKLATISTPLTELSGPTTPWEW